MQLEILVTVLLLILPEQQCTTEQRRAQSWKKTDIYQHLDPVENGQVCPWNFSQ
jgi:hypothetical protein